MVNEIINIQKQSRKKKNNSNNYYTQYTKPEEYIDIWNPKQVKNKNKHVRTEP